jgi:salicylate biosynthesis isochorismate synthase/menaquinone-specific isochorismate synthase
MTAGREGYQDLVVRALSAIGSQRFSKVVLAREIEVESEAVFSERLILKALEARNADCWTFLVRGRDGSAFVGASPELLCESHQGLFATDALAGTGALGDERLLLESEKNRREHQSVVDDIRARLDRFVVRLELPEGPSVKHLANLVHLHTPIRATLREGVRALDVAKSLHPTAAVAGAPTGAALDWLRQNEGFSRGWYTGAVGAVGAEGLTLAVALRSALITGHRARVFVGAGVVQGSTPEGEWFETERKAATMLVALGVSDG